jgi:uncharacterized protein YcnI
MTIKSLLAGAAALASVAGFASGALAHALMIQKDVKSGSWHIVEIGLPHGCAGSPTTAVRIKIPDGIFMVRPQVKAGWTLSMVMKKMDKPVEAEGITYTESVDEMVWSGGKLGDLEFDRFSALIKFPNEPGKTMYFKTIQSCEKGEHRWVEIPSGGKKWGEYKEPAPFINLIGEPKQEARAQ